jgi:hypothetical protein
VCWIAGAAAKNRAHGLARLRRAVARHGGTIVSPRYLGCDSRMRFRCRQGHEWWTLAGNVVHGCWCTMCEHGRRVERAAQKKARVLRRLQTKVKWRGGEIVPPGYSNYHTPVPLRCARGHAWAPLVKGVLDGGWCPICVEEDLLDDLRALAERRGGECLALSCRSGYERLAWRCVQGHRFVKSGNSVKAGKWCGKCRGTLKGDIDQMRRMARERGGECLSQRYLGVASKLRWRCREGHEWSAVPGSVIHGTWCPTCGKRGGHSLARLSIGIMRHMAAERGGACLSKVYYGSRVPLRWRCARGHAWNARPGQMRRGGWCPVCSHALRGTLEVMREQAVQRGGRCLSRAWNNHSEPLAFECARGHRFRTLASVIKTGVWCPTCRP